jgi:hypothetical protein
MESSRRMTSLAHLLHGLAMSTTNASFSCAAFQRQEGKDLVPSWKVCSLDHDKRRSSLITVSTCRRGRGLSAGG